MESGPIPVPTDGEILVRARYLSLDPYMRGRMNAAKSYAQPVEIGDPMEGETVAEVVESRHPDYRPGELAQARSGWRTHAAISIEGLRRVDPALAPVTTLGVLGMPGFTAYSGMKVIGQPKPGETVVVAAASGPVGSLVGQLTKLAGARAITFHPRPALTPDIARPQQENCNAQIHRRKHLPSARISTPHLRCRDACRSLSSGHRR